jgi:DNA-binding NtrC family response regulator
MITVADLPADIARRGGANATFELRVGMSLEEVERELVQRTLASTGGNKSETARILGVSVKTLYNWLKPSGEEDIPPASARELDER